jgi:hypothetical protein
VGILNKAHSIALSDYEVHQDFVLHCDEWKGLSSRLIVTYA